MTKGEFLAQLKQALQENVGSRTVQENMDFYNQYIIEETTKGKSEQEVLDALGDPWILARTIIDANDGTDQETVYEAGGSTYYSNQERDYGQGSGMHVFGLDTWWKKLLLILSIVMVVMLIFSIISGLVSLFAPILVPVLIVMFVIRLFGGRRS